MLPLAIGLGAAGVYSGYMKGKKNERLQEENDRYRKAVLQYSPWTNMQDPGAYVAGPGSLESAISSGTKGAMMGAMLGGGGAAGMAGGAEAAGGTSALSQGMGGGMTGMEGLGMSGGAGGGQLGKWQLMQQMMGQQDQNQAYG